VTHPFELRPATTEDRDALAELWHASASLPTVGPPQMPSRVELRERVDQAFAQGWVTTLAVTGNALVGFVAIKPAVSVLDQLFVSPDHLGGGVGRALLGHAMAEMPAGFTLFTASANIRARRFYEAAGLMFVSEEPHPRSGHPVSHYRWHP